MSASVEVGGEIHDRIGPGLLILVGVEHGDTTEDAAYLAAKCAKLRIFDDGQGVMNLDATQVGGDVLAISQFTLHASTRKGNRPSYIRSAPEALSKPLYEEFVRLAGEAFGCRIACGVFGADMKVALVNDGPVTIMIDSKNRE